MLKDCQTIIRQLQIRDWIAGGRKQKLCTARAGFLTMSFRSPKYKRRMLGIKTDQLVDILEVSSLCFRRFSAHFNAMLIVLMCFNVMLRE